MSEHTAPKGVETTDDPYAGFASRYDLFFEAEGNREVQVAFYDEVFKKHRVNRVLDCSCGTGEHLAMLSPLNVSLFGSDISPSMLAVAEEKMERLGLGIPLTRADFRLLPDHFPEPFDAILCLSTSLPHVQTEDEMVRALSSMHESLTDGGVLILTQGSSDRMLTEKPRFLPVINNRDFSRAFAIDYHGRGMTFHVLDFVHTDEKTEFFSWSASYPFIPLEEDYRRMLTASGFMRVDTYGGFDFTPFDETSEFLIVVAERESS